MLISRVFFFFFSFSQTLSPREFRKTLFLAQLGYHRSFFFLASMENPVPRPAPFFLSGTSSIFRLLARFFLSEPPQHLE